MSYKVSIEFCMMWNYAPKAASLAEELFTEFRHDITDMNLIPASGGAFEVIVNDEKIYSKLDTGVFPDSSDIINQIKSVKSTR